MSNICFRITKRGVFIYGVQFSFKRHIPDRCGSGARASGTRLVKQPQNVAILTNFELFNLKVVRQYLSYSFDFLKKVILVSLLQIYYGGPYLLSRFQQVMNQRKYQRWGADIHGQRQQRVKVVNTG